MGNQFESTTMMMKTFLIVALVVFAISTVSAQRRGGGRGRGGRGKPKCADGSAPTCSDGSTPTFDGDKSTPPCPDGGKPNTCADGSIYSYWRKTWWTTWKMS